MERFYFASSAEDALAKLKEDSRNLLLGGGASLRLWSKKKIHTGIDLTRAGLNFAEVGEDTLRLGATLRYHDFETDPRLKSFAWGIFPKAFAEIVGVQLRTEVQLGASVCGKFGFSDLLPVLAVLDARLEWAEQGEEGIDAFLSRPSRRDVLCAVRLDDLSRLKAAAFDTLRPNSGDLPLINVAMARFADGRVRLAFGATPGRAKRCVSAERLYIEHPPETWESEAFLAALRSALAEEKWGADRRASAAYREALAFRLLRRTARRLLEIEAEGRPALPEREGPRFLGGGNVGAAPTGVRFGGGKEGDAPSRCAEGAVVSGGDTPEFYFYLNGKKVRKPELPADESLFALLRGEKMKSVKAGCGSSCCGLCTVLVEGETRLSCTVPAWRVCGQRVETLEGLRAEAERFGRILASEGADQCGFCNPAFVLSVIAMKRRGTVFSDEEVKKELSGNLCRCTGYAGHLRAIRRYLTEVPGVAGAARDQAGRREPAAEYASSEREQLHNLAVKSGEEASA